MAPASAGAIFMSALRRLQDAFGAYRSLLTRKPLWASPHGEAMALRPQNPAARGGRDRQHEAEGGRRAGRALHLDLAPHGIHHVFDDGEPEPAGLLPASRFRAEPGESPEEAGLILLSEAGSLVPHLHQEAVALNLG